MGKKATKNAANKTTTMSEDIVQQSLQAFSAKRQFVISTVNMGWQLAGMVILPVFIGVKLDQRFDTSPSYTLAALVIAIGGAVMIVKNTILQVNKEQAEQSKRGNKRA